MSELPDLTIYLEALEARTLNQLLVGIRISNPIILRTAKPPIEELES